MTEPRQDPADLAPARTADLSRRSALFDLGRLLAGGTVLLPHSAHAAAREALAADAPALHRRSFLFGSPVDVVVRLGADEDAAAGPDGESAGVMAGAMANVIADVLAGLEQMHRRWNAWKPGDVSTLNRAFRDGRSATASPALLAMIRAAARLETESFGLFNPAIGAAVRGWGFHDDVMHPGARPRDAALAHWRNARTSLAQLEIRGTQIRSRNAAVQLDFGAYAKGVAIDWALRRLRRRGAADALVNLGGNLAAMNADGRRPWHIGIRDPFGAGLVASVLTQGHEAVVTSGSYERFRHLDGERFTHILDPHSAAPVSELVSVTVLHPSAALADAAATALLVAGSQRWRRVARRLGVNQVLIVDRHGQGEATEPLARRLQFASSAWRASISVV